jgi:phosphate-selective porin OprO and OprP
MGTQYIGIKHVGVLLFGACLLETRAAWADPADRALPEAPSQTNASNEPAAELESAELESTGVEPTKARKRRRRGPVRGPWQAPGPVSGRDGLTASAEVVAPKAPVAKAEFGEGIGVETGDGSFGMNLKARIQARTTVVVPDGEKDASADMQIRRMRVTLEGFAWKKLVTFKIQLGMANLDLDPVAPLVVRDAYMNFAIARDLEIRAGQMKVPYGRQRVVSSGRLQMVDRSVVTSEFNLDRDVGIQFHSHDFLGQRGLLGYNAGVFGGDGRGRVSGGYGLLYAGRVELRAFGGEDAVDLDEPDFGRSTKLRLAFGLSGAFNHKTDRQKSTLGPVFATGTWADYGHLGFDWNMKWSGLSITGETFWRRALKDSSTKSIEKKDVTDFARSGYGGFLQAGAFVTDHLELTSRVGGIYGVGGEGRPPLEKELGGGVSYYFFKHALKVQADYFYLFEEWGKGKHQARLQVQIAP